MTRGIPFISLSTPDCIPSVIHHMVISGDTIGSFIENHTMAVLIASIIEYTDASLSSFFPTNMNSRVAFFIGTFE